MNYVLYELTIQNISKGVLGCSSFLLTSLQSGHISFSYEEHSGRMVHVCGVAQGYLFIFGGCIEKVRLRVKCTVRALAHYNVFYIPKCCFKVLDSIYFSFFVFIFFGGLECVGQSFAYVPIVYF